eukprot:CAMPEP_0197660300 /NCGR_PEP_ID=MMETSP1338-20131121/50768_1 /TAXON_ID=43686 ORGANISM="Pelagodinium beii, Strain RCC1491" /NCGR_SAMPLE_ID=MMETSP1338 /ASSEMBLY_ACC=CAM_ASM_000754 /LENGTH=33 /DNA_ID= /DNA_START= /DNA_END= /DNA_ORIENTATION=
MTSALDFDEASLITPMPLVLPSADGVSIPEMVW